MSWGAVLAGVVVVLVLQMALMLLGLAIGTATIDPAGASPQASTLGISGAAWWLGATVISVFLGAWVAGRLAGQPCRTDGMLHGVVTWAAATLVAIYLLSTAIGGLVGGAFGALGSTSDPLAVRERDELALSRHGTNRPARQSALACSMRSCAARHEVPPDVPRPVHGLAAQQQQAGGLGSDSA